MIPRMLAFMRLLFWFSAVLHGSGAVVCLIASFSRPELASYALVWLIVAIASFHAKLNTQEIPS